MQPTSPISDPQRGLGRFYSYLNSAASIVADYKGDRPFSYFLKEHFKSHKKSGSKDRKHIAALCYGYFRLGKAASDLSVEQRILLGFKKTEKHLQPEWGRLLKEYNIPETEKGEVFPWKERLSNGIDAAVFEQSFFTQPDLFLRIRPGSENLVIEKLENAGIPYEKEEATIRLANTVKADALFTINTEVVIQDRSSQQIRAFFELLPSHIFNSGKGIIVWDCCAASGGKSLLAADTLPKINLTVSDIRAAILANLKKRFQEAGIQQYRALRADATLPQSSISKDTFELIIADVPCTGSGTWGRTPEQLYYFNAAQIEHFAALQQKIIQNVAAYLKPGGFFLYITCSVFKAENEVQVAFLERLGFEVLEARSITGYDKKADTLFGALLRKNNQVL